ncbi:MAG: DUF1801 domain-containing protein [Archangium sp.]|nr:DUF1801 domain-containing protein [Archangium sp.]MDP3574110.1 DUF1801 domain-containing protein [Archangium sp.]
MAKARSKKKAKSGSKTKSKTALKKKPAIKARSARAVKAKKPAPKKKSAKAPAKKVAAKAAPKKLAAKKPVTRIVPKATPLSPRKPLAPAVDRALMQADVEGLISRLPPPVQPVVKTLRRLVLEAAPEASELLDDGSPAYFANGVFARIVPSERTVLVKFLRGGHLPSASELTGDGETRTLSLSSLEELKETVLRKLVREAVMLNLSTPITVQA